MGQLLPKSKSKTDFYNDMVIHLYKLDDIQMTLPSKLIAKQLQQKYDISDSEFMGIEGVQGLTKALKKCTNLKILKLQIPTCHNIGAQGASQLGQAFQYLLNIQQLQIDIQAANRISDQGIQDLIKPIILLEKLQELDLNIQGVNEITDIGIHSICETLNQMKNIQILTFQLDEPNQVSQKGFKQIIETISNLKNLEKLGLSISQQLGLIEFEYIEKFYKNNTQKKLQQLNLQLNSNLENDCISILIKNCPEIKTLNLNLYSNTTWLNQKSALRFNQNIQSFTDVLEKLTLNFSNYQKTSIEFIEEIMRYVCQCKNLKTLELYFRILLMEQRLEFFKNIKNLQNLKTLKVVNFLENFHKYYEIFHAKSLVRYDIK
ncbi:hypothetical protein TTHERM_01146020 (macronuclear) [Tetrahymena thermophila SB210]|uniref:Kinase domain protein n=1 Tax=Tetrahymena thermophila (strain SB210) TaxID=312017 RepID=Q24F11_TETTS|nr:hypothetical protein TTHERM_01146020 [Tetrahymena thermophila SB210]EAS06344.2 hypothetical protein TTHERM_01146020 [Tetrahymena thermophila SB210]|eukprot:XP_001026589.2 hypothetical protein TTHERM_01146020 [Tetrahymena thermophila SB210]